MTTTTRTMMLSICLAALALFPAGVHSFTPPVVRQPIAQQGAQQRDFSSNRRHHDTTTTYLSLFDKLFEEEGPLGKGITVGKVQVALLTTDRSRQSIFGAVKEAVDEHSVGTNYDLACLAQQVCLALLRRQDSWTAASSTSQWFKEDDSGRAESTFNDWSNREAIKFEKEYPASVDTEGGGATSVVVSLILEMVGDQTEFDGAGFSMAQTEAVLQSIASDVMVEDGDFVNAVEVFWTPGESTETLTNMDLITDFPELVTL